ncbi:YesL family protein [Halalkalibacterium halodurans]|jgi:uncharacterized membrane protein YesL|uniref:Membrane protein YesL n=1 Tax=Halalkalibacterium halodurans TaxID=86665 RepID=A0A0M0KEE3_ALKHA|nr:DUF624 domain-containing protein [Halalkalibacterium halodurans]MDY7220684.1 DUF624 domain-containing protein [Halalkalibacterium halodurans]MDY7239923.1 DUF624 domain-containing protein [Halalkalibacterium halodurans]TPE68368.1 DUF624 domain-containing protein [Halalkalibacterium halodurans]
MSRGFVDKVDNVSRLIASFAYLNIVWLAFSAVGLFVFSFFPATAALFTIARKWVLGERHFPVARTYYESFKSYFFRANLYGWMMAVIGGVLYLNYQVMTVSGMDVGPVIVFAYLTVVVIYLLALISLPVVFVHFQGAFLETFKKTLLFVIGRIHLSLLFLVIAGSVVYLSLTIPTLILFFSGSVLAYVLMWFFVRSMESLEKRRMMMGVHVRS